MKKFLLPLGLIVLVILLVYGTYNYYTVTSETIVVGYLPSSHHSALFVADAKEMFEKEGLKVQMVPFRTGGEIVNAANKNQIDIGYCGITPITSAIDQNSTIKIVATVNEEGSGIVVSNSSNITNISDLQGKKILIPVIGGMQDVIFRDMLFQNNISSSDINITDMDVPLMQGALNSGKVDGFVAWEPYVTQAKLNGNDEILAYSNDIWPNHPCCVVVTTKKFMTQNPNDLRKFLKAHIEATQYINANHNETALIVSKKLGTNYDVELESLNHVKFIAVPTKEFNYNIMKLVDIQKKLGYVKNNLTLNQIVDYNYLP